MIKLVPVIYWLRKESLVGMHSSDELYNTPQEIAMRMLVILHNINQPLTKGKLTFFDFLSIHSSVIDEKSKSIHPDNPKFGLEFFSKKSNTEKAIHLLVHKKLVNVSYDKKYYYFEINIFGSHLVSMIDGSYKNQLENSINQLKQEFLPLSENNIQRYFDENIVHWGVNR